MDDESATPSAADSKQGERRNHLIDFEMICLIEIDVKGSHK